MDQFWRVNRQRQSKCKSFSRSRQVPRNDVLSVVDRVETVHLNWEKVLVASCDQLLSRLRVDFRERRKLSILHSVGLKNLRSLLLTRETRFLFTIALSTSIEGLFTFLSISTSRLLEVSTSYSHNEKLSLLKICKRESVRSTY